MSDRHQPVLLCAAPPRRLQQEDYTVAIICPMGDELSPVLALLDERHANLPTSRDQNAYELGRMGPHNIVVAAMPTIGNNAAAMVITQLCNDFGRVRFGLLVGVGGGIPDEDYEDDDLHDIRLGDVVVSESRGNFGGVVQFDRGKSTTSGFVRTGHLNKPPHILAGNVEKLKAVHNLHGNTISHFLDEMLDNYPPMKKRYSYPGEDRDRLFAASYPHQGGKSCKKCDITQAVEREQRSDSYPQIHYGTIGSSNMVIENTKNRDELRDSMDILCVEMEAAGLMEAFPCLVIRGISDYADSHKNEAWQPYAAATAAAYTKELLLQIPPDAIRQTQTITEALQGLSTTMDQVDQNTQKTERRTHRTEEMAILEWLSPNNIDFSTLQNASRGTHTPGTGQWLLDDTRYRAWRDGKPGLLWLHGAAGCGKTILSSTIIHNLQEHVGDRSAASLAYWYFRFDNTTSQNVSKMLRSIIRQVSTSPLPTGVQALRERHSKAGSEPSIEELNKALAQTLEIVGGDIYIVFDALDECPHADQQGQRKQLLRCITNLVSDQHLSLHLVVTSRPEPDIRSEVGSIVSYAFDIEELVKADVEQYVEAQLKTSELASWEGEIKGCIRAKLLSFQERRFRWADLQIKRFAQCPTLEDLEVALETIPESLELSYQEAFEAIDARIQGHVTTIMMWLAVSHQPLNAEQIAAVVKFRGPEFVLRICTTLLVTIIDENTTQIIKLAHFSVKEFLVLKLHENSSQWYRFSAELAHKAIAITALEALLQRESHLETIRPYAAEYWPQHATEGLKVEDNAKLEEHINLLFDHDNARQFRGWLRIHNPDITYYNRVMRKPKPLYYASILGFENAVRTLWINESQLSKPRGSYGNALNAAAVTGNVAIVQWIIRNCDAPARFTDFHRVIREIQVNGALVAAELCTIVRGTNDIMSMVEAAAGNEESGEEVMELLLEANADRIDITEDVVKAAARNEKSGEEVMKLLMKGKGKHIDITEELVIFIIGSFDTGVIKLLLEARGDQIDITEDIVEAAAGNRRSGEQVMKLLLKAKGDQIDITEDVVEAAARNEKSGKGVMELLLKAKGDQIDITEDVVEAAARNEYSGQQVMELLLRAKGDQIDITENVVKAAARNQSSGQEVMELLLEAKGDQIDITEDIFKAAAGNWSSGEEVMKLLLKAKGDQINITKDIFKSASGNEYSGQQVMELLLRAKGDQINITEDIVKAAAGNQYSGQRVMKLLQNGADYALSNKN